MTIAATSPGVLSVVSMLQTGQPRAVSLAAVLVESGFGGRAVGPALEAAVGAAAAGQTPGEDCWWGIEYDRQVRGLRAGVELPDRVPAHVVHALQDQAGGQVAVAYHDGSRLALRADLGGEVMVAVAGDQAGQRHPAVDVSAGADHPPEGSGGWFCCRADLQPAAGELAADKRGGGRLAGAARSVEADEDPADAHAGISGSSRRSPDVTGHTSASTAPMRSPAEMTAAGQPLPHEPAIPHEPQVGLAPIV